MINTTNSVYQNLNSFIKEWESLAKDKNTLEEFLFEFNFRNYVFSIYFPVFYFMDFKDHIDKIEVARVNRREFIKLNRFSFGLLKISK